MTYSISLCLKTQLGWLWWSEATPQIGFSGACKALAPATLAHGRGFETKARTIATLLVVIIGSFNHASVMTTQITLITTSRASAPLVVRYISTDR